MSGPVTQVIPMVEGVSTSQVSKARRRSIIREFALTTSTHGLPSIARSQSKHNFIFWVISFVIFTGIMIFFITQAIRNYFAYPTQTDVSIVVEQSQTFPAVTFCNYALGRYDRVIEPFLNRTNLFNLTNINDRHVFNDIETNILFQFLTDEANAGASLDAYYFSLDIMLISCFYNGEICTTNDFITFSSSTYGRCFTFNAKTKNINGSAVRHTNDYGGSGTLELRLYAHSNLYVPFVSDGLFH
jgi:hypothetical protein